MVIGSLKTLLLNFLFFRITFETFELLLNLFGFWMIFYLWFLCIFFCFLHFSILGFLDFFVWFLYDFLIFQVLDFRILVFALLILFIIDYDKIFKKNSKSNSKDLKVIQKFF